MLQGIDTSPKRIGMRFLGMSGEEANATIPAWAWTVGALALGVTAGVLLAPKIEMATNRLSSLTGKARQIASKDRKVFGRYG
jgi:hypothetical protein